MYVSVRQSWNILKTAKQSKDTIDKGNEDSTVTSSHLSFSNRMQEMRIRSFMTLDDMSKHLGIPSSQLARYERGEDVPSDDLCKKILFSLTPSHDVCSEDDYEDENEDVGGK